MFRFCIIFISLLGNGALFAKEAGPQALTNNLICFVKSDCLRKKSIADLSGELKQNTKTAKEFESFIQKFQTELRVVSHHEFLLNELRIVEKLLNDRLLEINLKAETKNRRISFLGAALGSGAMLYSIGSSFFFAHSMHNIRLSGVRLISLVVANDVENKISVANQGIIKGKKIEIKSQDIKESKIGTQDLDKE